MKKVMMVTGGYGYVGSWVINDLLNKGYCIRLTVRDKSAENRFEHLLKIAAKTNGELEIWQANLLVKGSFDKAVEGAEAIIHIASPFKLKVKDAHKELIEPALEGTRNVLEAANKSTTVKKVVLTSSIAAIYGDNIDMKNRGVAELTEEFFNESSSLKHQPYSYSKALAEKEAWKIYKQQNQWQLVVINPGFVMGPALNKTSDSESLTFINDMLSGKFASGVPKIDIGFVDVRDVAEAHVKALATDCDEGRYITNATVKDFLEFANVIKGIYADKYKLPTKYAPKIILLLFGKALGVAPKFIKRNVGYPLALNNSKSREKLGMKYRPIETTIKDMIEQTEK